MKSAITCIILLSILSCNMKTTTKSYSQEEIIAESKKVNEFLDLKFDESVGRNPESATSLGLKIGYDSWSDRSDEFADKELAFAKEEIALLDKNYNLECLDAQTKLSVRMLREGVKRWDESMKYRHHGYAITQMGGVHNDLPAFLINLHSIDSLSDAKAYISRLDKMDKVFDQTIEDLKKSESIGVIPPHFTFHYVTADLKSFITSLDKKDASNVLYTDFVAKSKNVLETTQHHEMCEQAFKILGSKVKTAYQKLLEYWLTLELKANAKGSNGVWSLPDGKNYYASQLEYHTTGTMSPDDVFETGTKEVARIQNEMRVIMKQVKFKSDSLQEFFNFVRTDKQFKYSTDSLGKQQLLSDANNYIDSMRLKLPQLFNTLPKAELIVKQVEEFREKSAGGAFYESPSEDGTRPGRYYVNTYNMNDEPKYQMEALTYHEAIPGHHMQIAIAQELKNVPKFRKYEHFTSYIEGWALYAEKLGKEMGMYNDPYSDFGRLSMEIFRAARLVVDAGIHTKRWTREQAIDYFLKNTANAQGDIEHEIERYFLWPGQATGYKIGMLKILELREKAEKDLGTKFDIRQFHDVLLTNGAVSLPILEELVNEWVEARKKT